MKASLLWVILAVMYFYLALKTRKSVKYIERELDPERYSGGIFFRRRDGSRLNLREFLRVVYIDMEKTNWMGFLLASVACVISFLSAP